jgi:hypothetical protein
VSGASVEKMLHHTNRSVHKTNTVITHSAAAYAQTKHAERAAQTALSTVHRPAVTLTAVVLCNCSIQLLLCSGFTVVSAKGQNSWTKLISKLLLPFIIIIIIIINFNFNCKVLQNANEQMHT